MKYSISFHQMQVICFSHAVYRFQTPRIQHSWCGQCADRIAYSLCNIQMSQTEKAGMALTFRHQTENNISHHSLESIHSVQNVTDD